jgi:hypothetical protein
VLMSGFPSVSTLIMEASTGLQGSRVSGFHCTSSQGTAASKSRITAPISFGHSGQSQKAVLPVGASVVPMSPALSSREAQVCMTFPMLRYQMIRQERTTRWRSGFGRFLAVGRHAHQLQSRKRKPVSSIRAAGVKP